jgi:hypothetical protein
MANRDRILEIIKQKYPRHDMRIEQLYQQDQEFKSLCEDYVSCLNVVQKINLLSEEQRKTSQDYETVIKDLEKELFYLISQ